MGEFDKLYFQFEERFRGSRELIRQRLEVYRPLVAQTLQCTTSREAIDYGSGRGEWLELLNEVGWSARGVDLNEDMVSSCRALALNVDHQDALAHASHLGDGSTGLITAFHLVEHLPIEKAFTLTRNAYRALCDSGMLILETPNPENLMVGTCGFYMDPTHVRPLPPDLLRFLVESAGFSIARIVRLYGDVPALAEEPTFTSVFRHPIASGPDYAVIGIKSPKPDQSEALEKFVREIGQRRPTDLSQAEELDNRWASIERRLGELDAASTTSNIAIAGLRQSRQEIGQRQPTDLSQAEGLDNRWGSIERRLGELDAASTTSNIAIAGIHQSHQDLKQQLAGLGTGLEHFGEQTRLMSEELAATKAKYNAVLASSSWKMTAPLRWLARVLRGWP